MFFFVVSGSLQGDPGGMGHLLSHQVDSWVCSVLADMIHLLAVDRGTIRAIVPLECFVGARVFLHRLCPWEAIRAKENSSRPKTAKPSSKVALLSLLFALLLF